MKLLIDNNFLLIIKIENICLFNFCNFKINYICKRLIEIQP